MCASLTIYSQIFVDIKEQSKIKTDPLFCLCMQIWYDKCIFFQSMVEPEKIFHDLCDIYFIFVLVSHEECFWFYILVLHREFKEVE